MSARLLRLDGAPWCGSCAARCSVSGHVFAAEGWRVCACDRSIPAHADAPPDPAGGEGCGMAWRLCRRCDHIDERHLTDPDEQISDEQIDDETVPGGHLRQDVPAGPALPDHHMTSEDMHSEETLMVEPTTPPADVRRGAR